MNRYALLLAIASFATGARASCGSDFCSLNTHWDTQGLASDGGLRVDLRYAYARANRLRAGSSQSTPAAPSGADIEIEDRRTVNQQFNLDAAYTIDDRWNVELGLPLVVRDHTHTFDSAVAGSFVQQASFASVGDVRVVGRYKLDLGSMDAGGGIRLGLKLPTGAIDKTMTPPDPARPAVAYALERAGQPGSGSTDAILGAYYFRNLPGADWGWFANVQAQSALATRDGYRPGRQLVFDLGGHYAISDGLSGLLQLNLQQRERDGGAKANPASGGRSWNLSPGLSYALTGQTQIYGAVQIALKQYANADPADPASGQLTAPWSVTVGIGHQF